MNAIRVQIHLKHVFDNDPSIPCHSFWYAFQPSALPTINDVLEDIRVNYLNNQISSLVENANETDERAFIVHLRDCQLLPFTPSQILRDDDRLSLMPLTKYKASRKLLQETMQLDSSVAAPLDPPSVSPEKNHKRQRTETVEQHMPFTSSIAIVTLPECTDEQPVTKKTKTKSTDNAAPVPMVEPLKAKPQQQPLKETERPPTPASSMSNGHSNGLKSKAKVSQELPSEKDMLSEPPLSLPSSVNGHLKELKSKTPIWKAQTPQPKGNAQDKLHIRFDSDSDDEPLAETPHLIVAQTTSVLPSPVNDNHHVAVDIDAPPSVAVELVSKPVEPPIKVKKTVDLLFEMKQHKIPGETRVKTAQQKFGKKRAQHRKRALDFISMANYVDHAFGLDKDELEKQIVSNGHQTSSSSTPQALPNSFNKLARLPLVAEALETNDKIYDLYPPVAECPPVQTRIAFKLLELSEDFCPTMSEFKEGTVMGIDPSTGELSIELDRPLETVFDQPSKFFAPPEDQLERAKEDEQEVSTMVVLPFSDLNSVRLLPSVNGNGTE